MTATPDKAVISQPMPNDFTEFAPPWAAGCEVPVGVALLPAAWVGPGAAEGVGRLLVCHGGGWGRA